MGPFGSRRVALFFVENLSSENRALLEPLGGAALVFLGGSWYIDARPGGADSGEGKAGRAALASPSEEET